MMARGYSRTRIGGCGCTLRAIVAVSDDGEMQALICTDPASGSEYLCGSCQQVCRTLNAALEACDFAQAARLTPEHFRLSTESRAHLSTAIEVLHEAMLEAIFEFESKVVPEGALEFEGQIDQFTGAYA